MEDNRFRLFDQNQFARALGVSRRTILRWRNDGKIPEPLIWDKNRPFWSLRQIETWQDAARHSDSDDT
jgi:predicted DNA-binding transcriptional regulator AlpA